MIRKKFPYAVQCWLPLLVVLFIPHLLHAENLIINGGFEDGDGVNPLPWRRLFSPGKESGGIETTGELRLDQENPHSGKASAYLKSEGPRWARFLQNVNIVPGGRYRVSGYVRSLNREGMIQISVNQAKDGENGSNKSSGGAKLEPEAANGQWTKLEFEFSVPKSSNAKTVLLLLRVMPAGRSGIAEAWFDDIVVKKID